MPESGILEFYMWLIQEQLNSALLSQIKLSNFQLMFAFQRSDDLLSIYSIVCDHADNNYPTKIVSINLNRRPTFRCYQFRIAQIATNQPSVSSTIPFRIRKCHSYVHYIRQFLSISFQLTIIIFDINR